MGVIKRQSLKKSMVSYVGVGIGAISTLFIFPMETQALGLIQFLVSAALLAFPIASLGTKLLAIRFFPDFKNPDNWHNSFLGLLLTLVFIGLLTFSGVAYLFRNQIYHFYRDREPLFLEFLPYAIGFTLLLTLVEVLSAYISNFHRVVIPHILNNLWIKVAKPALILLFAYQVIGHRFLVQGFLLAYLINVLLLVGYLAYLKELKIRFDFKFLDKKQVSTMRNYALFGILGSVGSFLATQIDILMVSSMLDFDTTGIYSMALFFATTIAIPMMAMMSITSPIVAEASKHKDYGQIGMLYKKTSISLFIAAAFLYVLILLNLDHLLNLLPRGDVIREGKYVIFLLGAAKVFDAVTSINGYIINYSKYYRFSLYALLTLGALNIILNQLFIPLFNINGVALATVVSVVLYNIIKLAYVYFRFKLLPFTWNTLKILAIAIAGYLLAGFIPGSGYDLIDMILKSSIFCIFFGGIILYLNIAPDITQLVREGINKIKAIVK